MSWEAHGLDVHPAMWSSLKQSAEWEKKETSRWLDAKSKYAHKTAIHILQGHIQTQYMH